MIRAINPSFGRQSIHGGVKDAVLDGTDVNNKNAAVGGVVAAGGVGSAAAVGARLRTMKNAAIVGQQYAAKAKLLNAKNASLLSRLGGNLSKLFNSSKATAWIARLAKTPVGKKLLGGFAGATALGITATQIYSVCDMASEAVDTYGN